MIMTAMILHAHKNKQMTLTYSLYLLFLLVEEGMAGYQRFLEKFDEVDEVDNFPGKTNFGVNLVRSD